MRDGIRLAVAAGVFTFGTVGWGLADHIGAAAGVALGLAVLVLPWRGQPGWSWAWLYLTRDRCFDLSDPVTVVNDRSGGGVRYQGGIAVAAIQLLGKRWQPTFFTGSATVGTANTVDVAELVPLMRQSLGLELDSLSVITAGARRGSGGDYPAIYDTLIGNTPYAGRRETWLVLRLHAFDNGEALRDRPTVGTAALAAAQRIAASLRCRGVRAKVASATDMIELEKRLDTSVLRPRNRGWRSLRGDSGWQTSYGYRPGDITSEALGQAWSLRADAIIQNITVFSDGTAATTVTVRTPRPPTMPPAVILQPLPGQQASAAAANLCGPRPEVRGLLRGGLPSALFIPIGPSGVLIGKVSGGERLLLPLDDPAEQTRVHIGAEQEIAKRIVIRTAAAGQRVTVHTTDVAGWQSVRMPGIAVIEHQRPAPGTTVSVVDGTVAPAPRPNTVLSVAPPGSPVPPASDIVIAQTGPATVELTAGGWSCEIEPEFFRAENRYITCSQWEMAE